MKRITSLLLLILFLLALLSGCTSQEVKQNQQELNFPGLEWGMTQSEVCTAMGLQASDGKVYPDRGEYGSILFYNVPVFGATAEQIAFGLTAPDEDLQQITNGVYAQEAGGLYRIEIVFQEDTDMEAVMAELTRLYGGPAEEYRKVSVSNSEFELEEHIYPSDEHCTYWVSKKTVKDYYAENNLEVAGNISEEKIDAYLSKCPRSIIFLSDDSGNDHIRYPEPEKNILFFIA